ncbi:hypothetical protein ACLB2K_047538 [Fragaria x ananassa]
MSRPKSCPAQMGEKKEVLDQSPILKATHNPRKQKLKKSFYQPPSILPLEPATYVPSSIEPSLRPSLVRWSSTCDLGSNQGFPCLGKDQRPSDALMTEEAAEKIGHTLGLVEQIDKMNIKWGICARVRVWQKLCDLVDEAFGELPFEFGSRHFSVKLKLKYERTVDFCKVCGMLIHSATSCGGLPSSVLQFIEIESIKTPFGFGGAARVSANHYPRHVLAPSVFEPSGVIGSGSSSGAPSIVLQQICNPFINPFQGLRTPPVVPLVNEVILVVIPANTVTPTLVPLVSGVKRDRELALVPLGKQSRGDGITESLAMVPYELSFLPGLALPHFDGVLTVSPDKKRNSARSYVEYQYCDAQADYCKSLSGTQCESEEPYGGVSALSILNRLIRSRRLSTPRYYNHYILRPRGGKPAMTKRDFACPDLLVWPKQGQPKGSKNKKHVSGALKLKSGPWKAKKCSFGTWKALVLGSEETSISEVNLMVKDDVSKEFVVEFVSPTYADSSSGPTSLETNLSPFFIHLGFGSVAATILDWRFRAVKMRRGGSVDVPPFTTVWRRRRRISTQADSSSVPDHFPFPASLPNSSFQARSILFKVLGDLAGKLEFGGLAGKGKWSGTLLESARVEARCRRHQTVANRGTSAL